jgi:hypothetical protein
MLTPGVNVSRSSNLRPRIGSVSTVSALSVVAADVRLDSITRGDVLTVTVSATPDTFIAIGNVSAWPTVSVTFSCTKVANPASVNVTLYGPGGSWRTT